jgi:hypothetical protein
MIRPVEDPAVVGSLIQSLATVQAQTSVILCTVFLFFTSTTIAINVVASAAFDGITARSNYFVNDNFIVMVVFRTRVKGL